MPRFLMAPPETEEHVALEVGDDDEGPGFGDVAGDPDFREDLSRDGDLGFFFAPLAVGDDDRKPKLVEAVLPDDLQVVCRVVAHAPVQGIGIREEVIAVVLCQGCNDGFQVFRRYEAGVAFLAEVQLDGNAVLLADSPCRVGQGPLEEPADRICVEFFGKIDGDLHLLYPPIVAYYPYRKNQSLPRESWRNFLYKYGVFSL